MGWLRAAWDDTAAEPLAGAARRWRGCAVPVAVRICRISSSWNGTGSRQTTATPRSPAPSASAQQRPRFRPGSPSTVAGFRLQKPWSRRTKIAQSMALQLPPSVPARMTGPLAFLIANYGAIFRHMRDIDPVDCAITDNLRAASATDGIRRMSAYSAFRASAAGGPDLIPHSP
jgi:hypothetical protein